MSENRTAQRSRTYKRGNIRLNQVSTVDCLVRSLSAGGASLEIESSAPVPDAFAMVIAGESTPRNCRVAWRKQRRIGVRFAP